MATQDDLNTSTIAVVGFIGAILVFAVIVLLMVVFYQVEARQQYEKDVSQPYAQMTRLAADQEGRLASYGWMDQKKGVAHIPVDRAMDLVAAELAQDPSADVTGAARDEMPSPESDTQQKTEPDRSDASAKAPDSARNDTPTDAEESAEPDAPPDDTKEDEDAS